MVEWLNYTKGYLRIRVKGFSPERFMNLCSNKGIVLWDIRKNKDAYEMCIGLKNFYELRPIARKTRTGVVILERYGLPFLLPGLRKRKMFLAGFVLALAFWIGSTGLIWQIEYNGNYQITDDMLQRFLKEEQIHVGMSQTSLNIEELEKSLRRAFPQITWTSVKLVGTRLVLDIKENDVPMVATIEEAGESCDLITPCGGRIISMIVRKGIPKVAVGEEVEAGAVLVEGTVPIYNDDATVRDYHYVHADADIVLEHGVHFEESIDDCYIDRQYTGRNVKRGFLRVGDKEWKLPEGKPFLKYDSVTLEKQPDLFKQFSIPICWGSITHREYQNIEHAYTKEEAENLLYEKCNIFLSTLEEKGVQIIEKDVKIDRNGDSWILLGDFLVEESVGVEAVITNQDIGVEHVE